MPRANKSGVILKSLLSALGVCILAQPGYAQESLPAGVEQVGPGVLRVDGSKVPSISLDTAAFEAAIKEDKSFSAAKRLLGGNGIPSVGPGGSTVHMYKVHDQALAKDLVLILFVNGNSILDYLIK